MFCLFLSLVCPIGCPMSEAFYGPSFHDQGTALPNSSAKVRRSLRSRMLSSAWRRTVTQMGPTPVVWGQLGICCSSILIIPFNPIEKRILGLASHQTKWNISCGVLEYKYCQDTTVVSAMAAKYVKLHNYGHLQWTNLAIGQQSTLFATWVILKRRGIPIGVLPKAALRPQPTRPLRPLFPIPPDFEVLGSSAWSTVGGKDVLLGMITIGSKTLSAKQWWLASFNIQLASQS